MKQWGSISLRIVQMAMGVMLVLLISARFTDALEVPTNDPVYLAERLFVFARGADHRPQGVYDLAGQEPAGSNGWLKAGADGRIYAGNRRIRFWGSNTMVVPKLNLAERWADQVAGAGFNALRFHGMDQPGRLLSANYRDRFDRYFAELKKRGVYIHWNWISHAKLGIDNGFSAEIDGLDMKTSHLLFFFDEVAQEWQKSYGKLLLTHRNPYTGLTYAEDPALAVIEIMNENGLIDGWFQGNLDKLPKTYLDRLIADWRIWLTSHYDSDKDIQSAWDAADVTLATATPPVQNQRKKAQRVRLQDWLLFLRHTERTYYQNMRRFLSEEMGTRALTIATIAQMTTPHIAADQDIIDLHEYWNYPNFIQLGPGRTAPNNWSIKPSTFVSGAARKLAYIAPFQIKGKPQFVTEFNDCVSHPDSGPGLLMMAAYASLQDWDGVFVFSGPHATGRISHPFAIGDHPAAMAYGRLASLVFQNGRIAPADKTFELPMQKTLEENLIVNGGSWNLVPKPTHGLAGALMNRTVMDLTKTETSTSDFNAKLGSEFNSDTGELVWKQGDPAWWKATTNTVRAYVGTAPASLTVGNWHLDIASTLDGNVGLAFVLTEGKSLAEPKQGLLVATGRSQNTGAVWGPFTPDGILKPGRITLLDWGRGPILSERIEAKISIPTISGKSLRVEALDHIGQVIGEIPVEVGKERTEIRLGSLPAIAYLLLWE